MRLCTAMVLALILASGQRGVREAQQEGVDVPSFNANGELILPADYREWVFIGSSVGMTYGPVKRQDNALLFETSM